MKKRIITLAALLVSFALLLSGCSYKVLTPDQLMRPPRYYGDSESLQKAFAQAVPNATMKAPYVGEYRSALIRTDIDMDGVEEALAFYVNNLDKNICRMMLLESDGDSWIQCSTVRGEGNEVVSVSIEDMDADGVCEIIVGWGITGSMDHKLSVYRYSPETRGLRSLVSESYRMMACLDFDNDAQKELFVVSSVSTVFSDDSGGEVVPIRFYARLLKMQEAIQPDGTEAVSVTAVSELLLPTSAAECTQILVQPARGEETQAVFLDCTLREGGMFTDIMIWSGGKLTRVETGSADNPFRYTYRASNIACQDVNLDGYIEIPAQMVLDGGSNVSAVVANNQQEASSAYTTGSTKADDRMYLTVWHRMSGGKLVAVENSVINFNDLYMFVFKAGWTSGNFPNMTNNVTVVADIANRTWSFYDYDSQTKVRGNLLFEIIVRPVGTESGAAGEQVILEDGGMTYTVRMGGGAARREVTYDDVVNGFKLLDA